MTMPGRAAVLACILGAFLPALAVATPNAAWSSSGPAGWPQFHGGGSRNGVVDFASNPVDVLFHDKLPIGTSFGVLNQEPYLIQTASGDLITFRNEASGSFGVCALVRLAKPVTGELETIYQGRDCAPFHLIGHDATTDTVVFCSDGNSDKTLVRAISLRERKALWELSPAQAFTAVSPPQVNAWDCWGGVIDSERRELLVAFVDFLGAENRIASVSLDNGHVNWWKNVPGAVFATDQREQTYAVTYPLSGNATGGEFWPTAITLADDAFLISGYLACVCESSNSIALDPLRVPMYDGRRPAMALFDRAGNLLHTFTQDCVGGPSLNTPTCNRDASSGVARGSKIIARLGNELYTLEAGDLAFPSRRPNPQPVELRHFVTWSPSLWLGDQAIWAFGSEIDSYKASSTSRMGATTLSWRKDFGSGAQVLDMLGTSNGQLLVLVRSGDDEPRTVFYRLDAKDAQSLQHFVVPIPQDIDIPNHIVPIGSDEFILMNSRGSVVVIGPVAADMRPLITIHDGSSVPGESLTIRIQPPSGRIPASLVIGWGDGIVEELPWSEEIAHVYQTSGSYQVTVSLLFADGLTSSASQSLEIGRQEELNFLQQAFSAEHQDTTWGIIGVAIAGTGGAFALVTRWHHRSRLERGLRRLDGIEANMLGNPFGSVLALNEFLHQTKLDLYRARINDAQFSVLLSRASMLMGALRARVLAPVEGRVGAGDMKLFRAAFEGAFLTPGERERLVGRVAAIRALDADTRAGLIRLVEESTRTLPAVS